MATESVQSHFNRSWLETEYSTAILRAQQAADWKGFERDKDIAPNLTWMPTSSADPRETHAVFWRDALTLPVDDPFWDEHRPGDLWNCKCWLKQTDAPATPGKDIPKGKDVPKPAKGLEQNPGKTAEMFSSKQPHYPNPKTCIWLKLAKGGAKSRLGGVVDALECPKNCNMCRYIDMSVEHSKNKEGKIVPSLTERKLVESDLETSSKHKILDNFITHDLLQSKKSLQRVIEHANTVDSLEAIKAIWIKPELANYIRKSELGEGKDPQSEKTIRNIEKKKHYAF